VNAPSEDVKDILEADGSLSLTFPTNLFIGKEPDTPDTCVTIFDTGEFPAMLTMIKGENYFYPTIQIMVRDNGYTAGYTLISNIRDALHGVSHETRNNAVYEVIYCVSGPQLLDYDSHNRARFVANFNLQRQST
jgi:hypothetical protein